MCARTRQVAKNISITPEMDKYIRAKIGTGMYQNYSEIVRAAIRKFMEAQK